MVDIYEGMKGRPRNRSDLNGNTFQVCGLEKYVRDSSCPGKQRGMYLLTMSVRATLRTRSAKIEDQTVEEALAGSKGANIGGVGRAGARALTSEGWEGRELYDNVIPVVVTGFIEAKSEDLELVKFERYEGWQRARTKNRDEVDATENTRSVGGGKDMTGTVEEELTMEEFAGAASIRMMEWSICGSIYPESMFPWPGTVLAQSMDDDTRGRKRVGMKASDDGEGDKGLANRDEGGEVKRDAIRIKKGSEWKMITFIAGPGVRHGAERGAAAAKMSGGRGSYVQNGEGSLRPWRKMEDARQVGGGGRKEGATGGGLERTRFEVTDECLKGVQGLKGI
ncbi:hypothetical protein C8R44DRAFT_959086 [Mycena epipterygia]|nr:hypothetical protein C8R44DRAFT_959086 [Mycena epipterygia]